MPLFKRVIKFLNKKKYVGEVIGDILLVEMIIVSVVFICSYQIKTYSYINLNDEYGTSKNCFLEEDKLYCETNIEVKQYFEE